MERHFHFQNLSPRRFFASFSVLLTNVNSLHNYTVSIASNHFAYFALIISGDNDDFITFS